MAVLNNAAARIEDIKHVQPVPRNHPPGYRVTFIDYDFIDLTPEDGRKLLDVLAKYHAMLAVRSYHQPASGGEG